METSCFLSRQNRSLVFPEQTTCTHDVWYNQWCWNSMFTIIKLLRTSNFMRCINFVICSESKTSTITWFYWLTSGQQRYIKLRAKLGSKLNCRSQNEGFYLGIGSYNIECWKVLSLLLLFIVCDRKKKAVQRVIFIYYLIDVCFLLGSNVSKLKLLNISQFCPNFNHVRCSLEIIHAKQISLKTYFLIT